jgi:polysaccharide biosynthesis transport protein
MRIAVGIATINRRANLTVTLLELAKQTRRPDCIFICAANPGDVDFEGIRQIDRVIKILYSAPGSSRQRNEILSNAKSYDVMLFLDDDFFPETNYLEQLECLFARHNDVVISTGVLIADGVRGPGLTSEEARAMLSLAASESTPRIKNVFSAYGCNMAVRLSCVFDYNLRFDENLPLYGWLEDLDFTRQIARYGRIVKVSTLRGVHLAVKSGRVSGIRFGYSQVANPIYLSRKKSVPLRHALKLVIRFCLANPVRLFLFPESYIDRFGRMRGNMIALGDLIRGRLDPRKITHL